MGAPAIGIGACGIPGGAGGAGGTGGAATGVCFFNRGGIPSYLVNDVFLKEVEYLPTKRTRLKCPTMQEKGYRELIPPRRKWQQGVP